MPLYDFRCTVCDNVDEHLAKLDERTVVCGKCGAPATRLIGTPRIALEGVSGDFPTALQKWEKMHTNEEIAKRSESTLES